MKTTTVVNNDGGLYQVPEAMKANTNGKGDLHGMVQ